MYIVRYFPTMFYRDGFQLLTNIIRNFTPDGARVLDPPQILIEKKLISYVSYQFCSIKIVENRRWRFGFCYFRWPFFITSVSYIYYIPEAVIKTCFTKKRSLKFPIVYKFEILTNYLKNTFKRFHLLVSCRSHLF